MLTIDRDAPDGATPARRLVLPWDMRCRSRLHGHLDDGRVVGLFLERGRFLRGGTLLQASDGTVVEVVAQPEALMEVRSDDAGQLARAAYHLGNRHTPTQLLAGALRFAQDHVLAQMLEGLGLAVATVQAPFEPEAGAYGAHGAGHGGMHAHPRGHSHDGEGSGPRIHDFGAG